MKDTNLRVVGFGNTLSEKLFELAKVCIVFEAPLQKLVQRRSQGWWSDRNEHELDTPRLLCLEKEIVISTHELIGIVPIIGSR
jgi:hypothetical protein